MRRKFSDTKFRWALWLGIGLFLGAMLANGILSWLDISSVQQSSGYSMIENQGYFVSFLLIVLLAPALEEFVFRFWSRGTNGAYITTMVLVPLMFMLSTFNWVASLCLLVALLLAYFLTRGDLRMMMFMIVTALGFGLAHLYTFTDLNAAAVFSIVEIIGLAFMLSFLAVNYGLLWAILGHILNNLIAFVMILLPMNFETEHYNVTLRPIGDAKGGYQLDEYVGDSLIIKADAELAAIVMMDHQAAIDGLNGMERSTYYRRGVDMANVGEIKLMDKVQEAMLPSYTMTIVPKDTNMKTNYHEVLNGLEKNGFLKLDTTYGAMYVLEVENNLFVSASNEECKSTLNGLIVDLRLRYKLPVLPGEGIDMDTPINVNYEILRNMSFEECEQYLKKLGIVLKKVDGEYVKMITCYGL